MLRLRLGRRHNQFQRAPERCCASLPDYCVAFAHVLAVLATACGDHGTSVESASRQETFDPKQTARVEAAVEVQLFANGLQDWRILEEFDGNAGAQMTENGACRLLPGKPISAIRYEGPWEVPDTNYRITFEARRVEGPDFFAALTFPVNSHDTCATFVPGGWGGSVTGISSIDHIDASANETTSTYTYSEGEWFTFRIEVRPETLKVWNGEAIIANVPLAGKQIGLRSEIQPCAPFGLATYMTTGEVRNMKISTLDHNLLWRSTVPEH